VEDENTGWQPIATAPKDGAAVLGFWGAEALTNGIDERNYAITLFEAGEWRNAEDRDVEYREPTHWMPLPTPPAAASPAAPQQNDYLRGFEDALHHAAFYVWNHCQHGEEHAEIIRQLKRPNAASPTAAAPQQSGDTHSKPAESMQVGGDVYSATDGVGAVDGKGSQRKDADGETT
jgi:hypothetical protein